MLRVANLVVVHDARDATRLHDRHPLVHLVPDDAGARPAPAGADTTARLVDDLLQTLGRCGHELLPRWCRCARRGPATSCAPRCFPDGAVPAACGDIAGETHNAESTTPKPQPDEAPRPPATPEPAEADQAIDIAGTEADEPAVGAAVEDRRRRSEPDEVNDDDPRR